VRDKSVEGERESWFNALLATGLLRGRQSVESERECVLGDRERVRERESWFNAPLATGRLRERWGVESERVCVESETRCVERQREREKVLRQRESSKSNSMFETE